MAYSSIAQAGYIIMAMAGTETSAWSAITYYLFVYAAANYALFFIISLVGRHGCEELNSLRGMGKQHPVIAAILLLTLFSLAGIPPLAGFMGKFLLFASAAKEGFYGMVIFAALNSTVSLYYYLILAKEAYITKPFSKGIPLESDTLQRASLLALTSAIILLGLLPVFSDNIMAVIG